MAVLGRLLVSSAERLDLPDLLSLDSYAAGDWKYFLKGLVGDTKPFILKGFDVIDPGNAIGTQSCSIRVADSITWYPGSNSGSFFHGLQEGHPQAAPLVPELRKNAVNYVYLTFSTFNTSVDTRAFWDPDKDGGVGGEFTQDVNTESVLKVDVNVSTGSFPANTVPVAKITVGPVVITAIEDARDLMFRLGSGGINPNPFNTYAWRTLPGAPYARQEPPTQMLAGGVNPFQGADKNILTLKEWMDAVMSKLRELGGTTYWYDDTSSFSIITNFYDAVATAFKSKGKWIHDTVTPGLLTWTEDIQIKMTSDPRTYIIRQGSKQLANEQVMYMAMQRNLPFNVTDENVSWINGQVYVNTIGGAVGLFANLSKGDYIKKANDTIDKWVRVEEFYDAVNLGGSTTTAAGARSVRIGSPYLGVTGSEKGRYDKGVYLPSEVIVSDRNQAAIANVGGNFHWLALRSDTIESVSNIVTTDLSVAIDEHDGSTARVTSVAHGLVDGDRVTIAGTTNFDGTYQVEVETADIFYINVSGGPFADESGTAHYAMVTTAARVTPYGFQEESANHGFNTNDTIEIADTTNYDGSYQISVRSATTFTIPVPGPAATETSGTATLAKVIVRTEGSVAQLIQGQVIDIGGSIADNIRQYVGMESLSQTAPNYTIPPDYNTLDGMQNYNGIINENLTVRLAKVTAMMADKAQDKTIQILASSGITEITNTTNGAAQELRFVPDGSSITIVTPSSNGQTFMALPDSSTPISLLEDQAAYITIDRNNPSTVTWTVADIMDVPLDENVFIVATRINTPEIYIWDATLVPSGSIPPPSFLTTIVQQNQMLKLVRGGTWSWDNVSTPANLATYINAAASISLGSAGSNTTWYGQGFTTTAAGNITSADVALSTHGNGATGSLVLEIYTNNAGVPGTLLGTSDPINVNTLYAGFFPFPMETFTFSTPVAVANATSYFLVINTTNYVGSADFWVAGTGLNQYAGGQAISTANSGGLWTPSASYDFVFSIDGTAGAGYELAWDADAFIQIPGLTEDRNTISAGSIALPLDGDVAYVDVNRLAGAPDTLTVSVDQIDSLALAANRFIIARRTGTDVIVGANSMLLVEGESKKLYAGMSDQNLAFIGAVDESDDAPQYSSNVFVTDGDPLTEAISDLDVNIRWKPPVADVASLPPTGNVDGDVRLVLDTRLAYTWHTATSEWLPVNGTGGGVKILGGGEVTWDVTSGTVLDAQQPDNSNNTALFSGGASWMAQTFTAVNSGNLVQVTAALFRDSGALGGTIVPRLYATSGGNPTAPIATALSNIDVNTMSIGSQQIYNMMFPNVPVVAGTMYAIVFDADGTTGAGSFSSRRGVALTPYAGGRCMFSNNSGASWGDNGVDIYFQTYLEDSSYELSYDADMFLEIKGLAYSENTIDSSQSPIVFPNDLDVAYVTPNLSPGGPALTITVGALATVPADALVIARREGDEVIVGSSSTRLKNGQSTELYAQESIQSRNTLRSTDFLRSDDPVTWTGSDLIFTAPIVLESLNVRRGETKLSTILVANSPIVLADGELAYVTIDRETGSSNVVPTIAAAVPTITAENEEIIIIGKRVDALGAGYLHIPLHKQVLEPGQTVRLGASGAGGGDANELVERLKERITDSPWELVTPNVFSMDKDDLIDGSSTGEYSLVSRSFEMDVIGETMVSTNMLDPDEFLNNEDDLRETELMAFWAEDGIDPLATYEVSRNGGNEWQVIEMERIGNTDTWQGAHVFAQEASNQTLQTIALGSDNAENDLDNGAARQAISQAFTVVNKQTLRTVTLKLNKVGSPSGNYKVGIIRDNAGSPSTSVADIMTETSLLPISGVASGISTVVISLPEVTMDAGTYHIVVASDAAYRASYVNTVTELAIRSVSSGTPVSRAFNGTIWSALTSASVFAVAGFAHDLRVRITSGTADVALAGYGIFYDKAPGDIATGIRNLEIFSFSGSLNTTTFLVNNFVVNPEQLKVYDVNTGQVYRYGVFGVSGQTVTFTNNQFYSPGSTITLMFDQTTGGSYDNSDMNALLMASNHLGSPDVSIDRSVAGRGIFLRRPDGTLREIAIDNSDNIVVYSV